MTSKGKRHDPRRYSRLVVDGAKQAPSRGMLRAVGFADADFTKPQVGIASTWANLTPCNMHLAELAREAAAGVDAAGAKSVHLQHHHGFRRHLDGLAGHALLAGVARGHRRFDRDGGRRRGLRRLRRHRRLRQEHARLRDGDRADGPPGGVRLRRHDPPGRAASRHRLDLRGGGCACGRKDLRCAAARGRAHRDSRSGQLRRHVHGEHDGLGDRGAGSVAAGQLRAGSGRGLPSARIAGEPAPQWCACSRPASRPRDILTRKSFENAITVAIALGGSTNAVLHLLAIANEARVKLQLDDFTRIGRARAGAGGSATERTLFDVGARCDRRHPAADENAARCGPAARRMHDGDRRARSRKISRM